MELLLKRARKYSRHTTVVVADTITRSRKKSPSVGDGVMGVCHRIVHSNIGLCSLDEIAVKDQLHLFCIWM